jgi:hypothetical protein
MNSIQITGKVLSKDEQKKIAGGWNFYCENNLQGNGSEICKTDVRCDLDVPLCEPV